MTAQGDTGAAPLLECIGHTPLVEIDLAREETPGVRLFAKLESVNPGGSVKDRPVARMLTRALADGRLEGRRLLDSSSGNAGISHAMLGAALGVPVTLVVPGNASQERLNRIRSHGAELIVTDPLKGYDFTLMEARRLAETEADRYWYCNQYANEDNWRAHYEGTAEEILEQFGGALDGGAPDAFVAGVGTGGTLTGVGRRLREIRPDVHVAAVIPDRFPGIEGLKPLGQPDDIVPEILDESLIDERIDVTIEDGLRRCRQLARYGLFVGPSSGAYVHGALALAARRRYRSIVTILSDTGERYVSTGMWDTQAGT